MSSKTFPNLDLEHSLLDAGRRFIIGIDEVGRGAIAGPVAVGAALIDSGRVEFQEPWPNGLADSKLMTEKNRTRARPEIAAWLAGGAVGYSSAVEIDNNGIVSALALAAGRALADLLANAELRAQLANDGAMIILDGSHNWLGAHASGIPVMVRTKADRDCVVVACASVLAKVARDNLMIEMSGDLPGYLLEGHKGYASQAHIDAVRRLGPSIQHRHTWLTKILAPELFSIDPSRID